jgi:hypothetical protein
VLAVTPGHRLEWTLLNAFWQDCYPQPGFADPLLATSDIPGPFGRLLRQGHAHEVRDVAAVPSCDVMKPAIPPRAQVTGPGKVKWTTEPDTTNGNTPEDWLELLAKLPLEGGSR